jgi:hypothetical protein
VTRLEVQPIGQEEAGKTCVISRVSAAGTQAPKRRYGNVLIELVRDTELDTMNTVAHDTGGITHAPVRILHAHRQGSMPVH